MPKKNNDWKRKVKVIEGNIVKIDTDAIITLINSEKLWSNEIDKAIQSVANNTYHKKAAQLPLSNLTTIFVKGKRDQHKGNFDHVVFVVDNSTSPLCQVIKTGLETANLAEIKKVSIPAIKNRLTSEGVELLPEEIADKVMTGIEKHFIAFPNSTIESILIVVHSNEASN